MDGPMLATKKFQPLFRNVFKLRYAEQFNNSGINQTFLEEECGITKEQYLKKQVHSGWRETKDLCDHLLNRSGQATSVRMQQGCGRGLQESGHSETGSI